MGFVGGECRRDRVLQAGILGGMERSLRRLFEEGERRSDPFNAFFVQSVQFAVRVFVGRSTVVRHEIDGLLGNLGVHDNVAAHAPASDDFMAVHFMLAFGKQDVLLKDYFNVQ